MNRSLADRSVAERSGRVSWIASLMQQLLEEVRVAPLGVTGRIRVAEIHRRSVGKRERGLAMDVVDELEVMTVPFCGRERSAEPGIVHGPVSRVDRLLDNIETAQFGQQRQRQRQQRSKAAAVRSAHAAGGDVLATDRWPPLPLPVTVAVMGPAPGGR